MPGSRPLVFGALPSTSLLALSLCAVVVQARTHIVIASSHTCYNAQNQRINCPVSKVGMTIAFVVAGIFAIIGFVYLFAYREACGACSCCRRRKAVKVPAGETYQQLSEPSVDTSVLPTYAPTYAPTYPQYPSTPSSTFINPALPPPSEKTYETPNQSVSDFDHDSYSESHGYYAPPQLSYEYKSSEDLAPSSVYLPTHQ